MSATARGAGLKRAEELAHLSVNGHHSYDQAWQQASAIALVSIAESLETIAARLDSEPETIRVSGSDGAPYATED